MTESYYARNRERCLAKANERNRNLTPEQKEAQKAKKRISQAIYRNSDRGIEVQKKATKNRKNKLQTDKDAFIRDALTQCAKRSKKSGMECNLTVESLTKVFEDSKWICAETGKELSILVHDNYKASIDRIDSSKGYTVDNIQIVGSIVNIAKNDLASEVFREMCILVSERYENGKI